MTLIFHWKANDWCEQLPCKSSPSPTKRHTFEKFKTGKNTFMAKGMLYALFKRINTYIPNKEEGRRYIRTKLTYPTSVNSCPNLPSCWANCRFVAVTGWWHKHKVQTGGDTSWMKQRHIETPRHNLTKPSI